MAIDLSPGTLDRLHTLFGEDNRAEAEEAVRSLCAEEIPLWHDMSPVGLERVRYAVLKLSGGDISKLLDALELASIDWRDALVAAGFGDDPMAHESWWPAEG